MKILTVLMCLLAWCMCHGQIVTTELAEALALEYLQNRNEAITHIKNSQIAESGNYYVVNVIPEGWAVISANMRGEPVQSYGLKETYEKNETNPIHLELISSIDRHIGRLKMQNGLHVHQGWQKSSLKASTSNKLDPIITCTWNQQCMEYVFDNNVPLAGCVSVAMAQVMYSLKYPASRQGRVYEYDKMPERGHLCSEEKARLIYDCGRSVNTSYAPAPTGSSARLKDVMVSMPRDFNYEPCMHQIDWQGKEAFY